MSKHTPHHWNILQTRSSDWEELSKQIDQPIDLQYHANNRPSTQHQCNTSKECHDAPDAILAAEEPERSGSADGESEAREEEYVAEGEEGRVEEE